MEPSAMMNFLAQPEGGDLMEVLVLLIIMALSALGSVLKSRKGGGKKKAPPKAHQTRRRPVEKPSHSEREILERPDRPRASQPFGLKQAPEIGSPPKAPPSPSPVTATNAANAKGELGDSTLQKTAGAPQILRSPMEPAESAVSPLEKLSLDDLKKAIVLRELLGPPRSLEAYRY